MKAIALAGVLAILGCSHPSANPEVWHGTHRYDFTNWDQSNWIKPEILRPFKDGEEHVEEKGGLCGSVEALGSAWKASAIPDVGHGYRYFHTREAAVAYVEQWCQP